jgi:RimJ/RimL family protein N-acetyltransferase
MPIETARLLLDTWQNSHWTAFRPLAQDPRVMRYITGGVPWSEEKIRHFVERQVSLYAERGFCRWRLLDRANGEFIGFCGVGFWGENLLPEIGWWLAPGHWGRGLATEAARCALRDIFERCGLPHIWSVAQVENTASRRVMEKIGLRFESTFQHEGVNLVRYEILHADDVRNAPIDV